MVESDEILPGDMPLLYRDPKLLAVSKPAFLRMGGEFSDTVSSRLKAEHGLTDATIKTVHQLDYATSGVLVTATQKQSAAVLTSLFQERLSKKAYVALVELPDSGKFFPSLSEASLPAVYGRESLEQGKKMAAVRPETAEKPNSTASSSASFEAAARSGPEHVLYPASASILPFETISSRLRADWPDEIGTLLRSEHVAEVTSNEPTAASRTSAASGSSLETSPAVLPSLPMVTSSATPLQENTPGSAASSKAPAAARVGCEPWVPSDFTKWYRSAHDAKSSTVPPSPAASASAPSSVAASGDGSGSPQAGAPTSPPCCFHVQLPVASVAPDDFRMCWGNSAPGREGRPAQTLGVLTHTGRMRGRSVGRVLLFPRSGRRHYLRVHMAAMGMPICGDGVYGATGSSPRMALHAYVLHLPCGDVRALRRKTFRKVVLAATNAMAEQGGLAGSKRSSEGINGSRPFASVDGTSGASTGGVASDGSVASYGGSGWGASVASAQGGQAPAPKRRRVESESESVSGGAAAAAGTSSARAFTAMDADTMPDPKSLAVGPRPAAVAAPSPSSEDREAALRVCEHLKLDPKVHAETVAACLPCRPLTFYAPDPFADLVQLGNEPTSVREVGSGQSTPG